MHTFGLIKEKNSLLLFQNPRQTNCKNKDQPDAQNEGKNYLSLLEAIVFGSINVDCHKNH